MTNHGEFNWNELQTTDANKAVTFFRECIGWQFHAEKMPSGGTYWIGMAGGKPVCGVLTVKGKEPDRWIAYVHVDSLDDALAQVTKNGGQVLVAPWDVTGVGRVAMIRDPGGAELGWVTPVSCDSR